VLCAIDFFLRVASDTELTYACQNAVHEGICHMTFLIGRVAPIFFGNFLSSYLFMKTFMEKR
jgi:hypothetical protein